MSTGGYSPRPSSRPKAPPPSLPPGGVPRTSPEASQPLPPAPPLCPNEHAVHDLNGEGVRITCGKTTLYEELWPKSSQDRTWEFRWAMANTMGVHERDLMRKRIESLEKEIEEYEWLFAMQQRRIREATEIWRMEDPGRELTLPDLGRLLEWMLYRLAHQTDLTRAEFVEAWGEGFPIDQENEEIARLRAKIAEMEEQAEADHLQRLADASHNEYLAELERAGEPIEAPES